MTRMSSGQKRFPSCPRPPFILRRQVPMRRRLQEYVSLANLMRENTGVVTTVRATLRYTVKVSALVNGTPIENSAEATLIFPVTGDTFAVQGEPVSNIFRDPGGGRIVEVLPVEGNKDTFGIILVVLFSGTLLWPLIFSDRRAPRSGHTGA